MAMLSGGTIIPPTALSSGVQSQPVIPDSKFRITWIENAVPTDALVGASSGPSGAARTPANGELACNVTTGYIYERQAGVWTRIDTV
jgi:hypothetical protein